MKKGEDGVSIEHVGAGISHHRLNPCPYDRIIAVHRAKAAGGFILLKRAFLKV
jgi:hypothetical protein